MNIGRLLLLGSHYSSSDFATCMICWAVILKMSNMGESKLSQLYLKMLYLLVGICVKAMKQASLLLLVIFNIFSELRSSNAPLSTNCYFLLFCLCQSSFYDDVLAYKYSIWCTTGIYLALIEVFLLCNWTLKECENLKQFVLVYLSQNVTTKYSAE